MVYSFSKKISIHKSTNFQIAQMKVQLVPVVPAGDAVELEVDDAGLQLGRGPVLKIDSTSVSRKHVILSVKNEKLRLLCLHR